MKTLEQLGISPTPWYIEKNTNKKGNKQTWKQ